MSRKTIHFKSAGVDITAELFSPDIAGKHPLVVMAYGTGGMMQPFDSMYIAFAEALAKARLFFPTPRLSRQNGNTP
jgi:hypothetical protein